MEDKRLSDLLNVYEDDRLKNIKELKDEAEKNISEQNRKIDEEAARKKEETENYIKAGLEKEIEHQVIQQDDEIQKAMQAELSKKADEIMSVSKHVLEKGSFDRNSDNSYLDEISFTCIYGHISSDNPNKIGIMFPSYTKRKGNGEDFLPERIKALALETILQNKETLGISKISYVSKSDLAVVSVDFDELTAESNTENNAFRTYEQTLGIDIVLEDAYNNDPILNHAKLRFDMSEGKAIKYLVSPNLMLKTSNTGECTDEAGEIRALRTKGYVSEEEAVKYLFDLNPKMKPTAHKFRRAQHRFREESVAGTFRRNFNNFNKETVEDKNFYNMLELKRFKEGEKDTVKKGKKNIEVHCRYIIPVTDSRKLAEFFKHGAYSEKDAIAKYRLTRPKLSQNIVHGNLEKHELETADGTEIFYDNLELKYIT